MFYTYYKPTTISNHSSEINSCYAHYIKTQTNEIKCINSWVFLNLNKLNESNVLFDDKEVVNITQTCFLIKYEVKNAGHTLIDLLNQLIYYNNNHYTCKIIIQNELINMSKYIYTVISLFVNIDNLIIIDSSKIYNFENLFYNPTSCYVNTNKNVKLLKDVNNELHISALQNTSYINYGDYFYNIPHSRFDELLINNIKNKLPQSFEFEIYDNICLIKNSNNILNSFNHINISYSIERSFDDTYIQYFTKNNYKVINPSDYNVIELYILLNNAKNIVTSWGCNSYINKMIIDNKNINYFLLIHKGYTHELPYLSLLDMIPPCKNVVIVFELNSNLDELNYNVLNNAMTSL